MPPRVSIGLRRTGAWAAAAPADGGWLSAPEQARLAAIALPRRRAQFIAGRWLARHVIAAACGRTPEAWPLSAGDDGPPRLLVVPPGSSAIGTEMDLGLSHSGDHVCCAFGAGPVGIDIEDTRRPRDWPALAELVCSPAQRRHLDALDEVCRGDYFYALWTLKEAWVKQQGLGMSPDVFAGLEAVPVDEAVGDAPAHWSSHEGGEVPGHALAWRGSDFAMALVAPVGVEIAWLDGAQADIGPPTVWRITPRC